MTNSDPKKYMIIAPGGNLEHVNVAVNQGAHGVYVGPQMMSGRSRFAEMNMDDVREARRITRAAGVSLYVAVNRSIPIGGRDSWKKALEEIAVIGPDALIIGSFCVLELVREMGLDIPLHASSFMGIYNPHGAEVVKNLGFRRIVLNTGLSDREIKIMTCLVPDMEFELIICGGICPNDSHRCSLPHGLRQDNPRNNQSTREAAFCQQRMILTDENQQEINRGRLMCLPMADRSKDINKYLQMGIRHFKIAGRERSASFVRDAVHQLQDALEKGQHAMEDSSNEM